MFDRYRGSDGGIVVTQDQLPVTTIETRTADGSMPWTSAPVAVQSPSPVTRVGSYVFSVFSATSERRLLGVHTCDPHSRRAAERYAPSLAEERYGGGVVVTGGSPHPGPRSAPPTFLP